MGKRSGQRLSMGSHETAQLKCFNCDKPRPLTAEGVYTRVTPDEAFCFACARRIISAHKRGGYFTTGISKGDRIPDDLIGWLEGLLDIHASGLPTCDYCGGTADMLDYSEHNAQVCVSCCGSGGFVLGVGCPAITCRARDHRAEWEAKQAQHQR